MLFYSGTSWALHIYDYFGFGNSDFGQKYEVIIRQSTRGHGIILHIEI